MRIKEANASCLPGANGFNLPQISRCFKGYSYSKEFTSLGIQLQDNPMNQCDSNRIHKRYDPDVQGHRVRLTDSQIQKKYDSHASQFGLVDEFGKLKPRNRKNIELFKDKITEHIQDPLTRYKKNIQVIHYFNEATGIDVMVHMADRTYLSGWKLNPEQKNVVERGSL
jgi:hypothetical protein